MIIFLFLIKTVYTKVVTIITCFTVISFLYFLNRINYVLHINLETYKPILITQLPVLHAI